MFTLRESDRKIGVSSRFMAKHVKRTDPSVPTVLPIDESQCVIIPGSYLANEGLSKVVDFYDRRFNTGVTKEVAHFSF